MDSDYVSPAYANSSLIESKEWLRRSRHVTCQRVTYADNRGKSYIIQLIGWPGWCIYACLDFWTPNLMHKEHEYNIVPGPRFRVQFQTGMGDASRKVGVSARIARTHGTAFAFSEVK